MIRDEQRKANRIQFERSAELAQYSDPYSVRWSVIHEKMAEIMVRRLLRDLND